MECVFLNTAGQTLFVRSDMESGHWVQEELSVNATFPFDPERNIERGQRIAFWDADDVLQVFEIRSVSTYPDGSYQQLTAEHIAVSELQDEHIDTAEITDKTASQALTSVLSGTSWSVGTNTSSGTQSADISRGSVWQAVKTIEQNWNVYIIPRVTFSSGSISGKYLDIIPAGGTWRGLRLSVRKNLLDPIVTYNDEEVLTALYGYGGSVEVTHSGSDDTTAELTFANVVWSATSSHPAKPSGQTYLEWPEKTALYGRNGRPRFGYYQNANIKDASLLLEKTWEALQETADPKISISGTCADLYRLGYADEPLRLHDLAVVEIEETGEQFYKEVIRLDIDLVDQSGNTVDIGDYIPNIIYINRETAEKARGGRGGGGGRGQTKTEAELSETFAEFEKTDSMIGMVVGTRNGGYYVKAGEIALAINETGTPGSYESTAYITADHVNISATSTVHSLAGEMHVDANGKLIIDSAGGMYVERTESGVTSQFGVFDSGNLTGGIIVNKVNGSTGTYITGDHVNISATGTAQTLAAAMEMDSSGNLVIKEGAGLYAQHTVGGSIAKFGVFDNNTLTGGVIVTKVNGATGAYITADHVNISGSSTVYTLAGSIERGASGLIIKDAGGLYVQRTEGGITVNMGVYDQGNLTGGVIVTKVNGSANTYITGDHINISATSTAQTLAGAMEMDSSGNLVIKEGAGLYVEHTSGGSVAKFGVYDNNNLSGGVIVGKVNGQSGTYVKIQASKIDLDGYVTTSMMESAFTDAQQINVDQLTINNYLTCLGYNTEWKSKSVVTNVTVTKSSAFRWAYCDANGNVTGFVNQAMVSNVESTSSTINYLGR